MVFLFFFSLLFVLLAPFTQIILWVRPIHVVTAWSVVAAVCAPLCKDRQLTLVQHVDSKTLFLVLPSVKQYCTLSCTHPRGLSLGSALDSALSGRLSLTVRPPHSWLHHLLISQCGLQTWYTIWGWLNPWMWTTDRMVNCKVTGRFSTAEGWCPWLSSFSWVNCRGFLKFFLI